MRTLKIVAIVGLCAWLFWSAFSAVFLAHSDGKIASGGFPLADQKVLESFLSDQGFVRDPSFQATSRQERFCGGFQGSRLFYVTVSTDSSGASGITVEVSYDYRGFTRSVDESARKAKELAGIINRWISERRLMGIDAKEKV